MAIDRIRGETDDGDLSNIIVRTVAEGMVVRRLSCLFLLTIGMIFSVAAHAQQRSGQILADQGYAGSQSCRQCHERFYELWSTSRHGLAMQPYTTAFGAKNLTAQRTAITIEKASYRADITSGLVIEKGPKGW